MTTFGQIGNTNQITRVGWRLTTKRPKRRNQCFIQAFVRGRAKPAPRANILAPRANIFAADPILGRGSSAPPQTPPRPPPGVTTLNETLAVTASLKSIPSGIRSQCRIDRASETWSFRAEAEKSYKLPRREQIAGLTGGRLAARPERSCHN
jgi:hypothetical protein